MRIDPPADQPATPGGEGTPRSVEEVARISTAMRKSTIRDAPDQESPPQNAFSQLVEKNLGGGDSSVALDDPDRDAWTQEVIGSRIHWQYGPDGRRKPMFRHHTRRLDDNAEPEGSP